MKSEEQEFAINQIDAAQYAQWVEAHKRVKECTAEVYDLSERRHNVDRDEFNIHARAHSKNPDEPTNSDDPDDNLSWDCTKSLDEIIQILNSRTIECYNGWLSLEMNNSGFVTFGRSDIFDSFKSLFPDTLFYGIKNKLDRLGATDIQVCFTYYNTPVKRGTSYYKLDKVAFKVTYTANGKKETDYYDMSDDPL